MFTLTVLLQSQVKTTESSVMIHKIIPFILGSKIMRVLSKPKELIKFS